MATDPLRAGENVYVFYRMNKRCLPYRKYLAVLDARHGAYRPRLGLSEGWVPARVVRDQLEGEGNGAGGGQVCIEYRWPHFATKLGHMALGCGAPEPWTEWFRASEVRRETAWAAAGGGMSGSPPLCPLGSRPDLAIIAFRWGGKNEITSCLQWGETGSSISDTFLESFIDSAVVPRLGYNYEIWTVFVEDTSDMVKVAQTAHHIFGPTHPARRAGSVCSMFFLWPTGFEENCIPTLETGNDGGAALVHQKSLFSLIQAMERVGIPTRFPHCSGLYESLTSKRWTYQLSLVPHLRIPATVALPRMLVEVDVDKAAEKAAAQLATVRQQQAELRGETVKPPAEVEKGVAKLGFSWEALDVKLWHGRRGLRDSLFALCTAIEISSKLTGQPHDLESIIVQEYIPHDLELRAYVVDGKIEAMIYTKFLRVKENNEFGDFEEIFERDEAARRWMGNDVAALQDGECKCQQLTSHWLDWILAQTCEPPPAIRFDYFVKSGPAGQANVWTLEICELGFCMLGNPKLPSKVFAAMLRCCLNEGPTSQEAEAKLQQ
eukprot:gnl/TRDRNA2_/TRDRNA2_184849_c0_seq1.p1 gnl/TRDRNA2_/TRDRNA2_184849_c0~~gnl/TRDRNA2_/TRDRNA2_184849_c0_seq1.p1  ORF type:complete len:548 (-),score=89.01 gnl/TRDRNA2_/TRDRNA2_184849_c0_seq1:11-1654(-)